MSVPGRNASSIELDNAYSIDYNNQSDKHPLYGFRDTEFSGIALGRTIVTGMLVLNREFKNELSIAIKGDLGANERPESRPYGNYVWLTGLSTELQKAKDLLLDLSSTNEEIKNEIVSLSYAAKEFGVNINFADFKSILARQQLDELIKDIESRDLDDTINNNTNQTVRVISEKLRKGSYGFTEALKNKYWRKESDVNNTQRLTRPSSEDVFEYLRKHGYDANLEIHFGEDQEQSNYADHKEVIKGVYFTGDRGQANIDSREINKVYYSFIARSIV